jgi:putative transposase
VIFKSMKQKQLTFGQASEDFNGYWKDTNRKFHGGVHAKDKRKTSRPLDTKKPVHLVMSSAKAKGSLSFRSPVNKRRVDSIIQEYAQRFGVRVYDYSNNGNHLHLSIKISSREGFQKYLRTVTGLIARVITKAKKGQARGKFWDALAFTRVADWGRGFANLKKYIFRNVLEASGAVSYDRNNLKFIKISSTA